VDVFGEDEVGDGEGCFGEAEGERTRGEGRAGTPILAEVWVEDGVVVDGPAVAVDLGGEMAFKLLVVVFDEGLVGRRHGLGDVLGDTRRSGQGEGAGCVV
jgi:hypothetical protein